MDHQSAQAARDRSKAAGTLHDRELTYLPVASLRLRKSNPRTHSPKQIRQIADSIECFGFTNPVLIDGEDQVIAGHGRVIAARKLGIDQVPTVRLEYLNEAQIRAYVIADNKLAENAGWAPELLALELQGLDTLDLDFDLTVTGFETAEIDLLIGDEAAADATDEPVAVDPDEPLVTQPGDLWLIGPHRLLCADAREAASYQRLMDGDQAQMVFVDPPYNVPIRGHVSGLGRVTHDEFAMASGEMSASEFTAFLKTTLGHHAVFSADGAIHFVCIDWRHLRELLDAGDDVYDEIKNLCVWSKTNAGMGSLYRSQHELILVCKAGQAAHINNVELGRFGRNRTNVWQYAGANTLGAERTEALAMHPTVKPVALVADAIRDCSHRGGIVLDGFAGAGTTLLACDRTGRIGYGIEIAPRYVDVAIRRLAIHAGLDAVHEASGKSLDEVKTERVADIEQQDENR